RRALHHARGRTGRPRLGRVRPPRQRTGWNHADVDLMALLVGLAAGAAIGYLLGRARSAQATVQTATPLAEAEARARAAEEKAAVVEEQIGGRFQALSTRALDANNLRFLELAESRLAVSRAQAAGELEQRKQAVELMLGPLKETLAKVEAQLRDTEMGRRAAHAELAKQIEFVRRSSEELRAQAGARGGELELRSVAELAAMARFCDFDEQATAATADGAVRPDMVVRLAGGKNIIVDSKVSLAAYLEAAQTDDPDVANAR